MCFYFGKNAPSFWHPLGSSEDCVAASEAMRFSCVHNFGLHTLFVTLFQKISRLADVQMKYT